MKRTILSTVLLVASFGLAFPQVTPPDVVNYQGVLRDSSDRPLDGSYAMVFRFFSAETDGDEILVDVHADVTVSGGLFNVQLGSGSVTDGSGPGEYTGLSRVYADYPDLHLEIEVGGETLSPRIRVVSAGHALNTRYVRGKEMVSDGPLDLYVDGTNGDDLNDGLSQDTAKRTIQAAVDAVPLLLDGTATIHIADGTYNESIFVDRQLIGSVESFPPITLLGNEASPESVVLDGQGTLENGVIVVGFTGIRGLEVRNYSEHGLQVNWGYMEVANCRIIGNGETGRGWTAGMAAYSAAVLSVTDCLIANNLELGFNIGEGASSLEIENSEISGNGLHGIEVYDASEIELGSDGNLVIQDNGGVGVNAMDGATVDFWGSSTLTIQSNTGGSMDAAYHSTIRGYGNGTTGSCSADSTSVCEP